MSERAHTVPSPVPVTRREPPPPPEELASGGFPLIVFGATSGVPEEMKRLEGWELSWSDEFDGDALDRKKWTPRANASAPGLEYAGGQQQWRGGCVASHTTNKIKPVFKARLLYKPSTTNKKHAFSLDHVLSS